MVLGTIPTGSVANIPITYSPYSVYLDANMTKNYRFLKTIKLSLKPPFNLFYRLEYMTEEDFNWRILVIIDTNATFPFSYVFSVPVTKTKAVRYYFRAYAVGGSGESIQSDNSTALLVGMNIYILLSSYNFILTFYPATPSQPTISNVAVQLVSDTEATAQVLWGYDALADYCILLLVGILYCDVVFLLFT